MSGGPIYAAAGTRARTAGVYLVGYTLVAALGVALGWLAAVQHNSGPHASVAGPATFPDLVGGPLTVRRVTVAGQVSGLLLGKRTALRVQLKNRGGREIILRALAVRAHDASRRCRAKANLVVDSYDASRRGAEQHVVRAYGTHFVTLDITLVADPTRNQDSCKNAVFVLDYTATATTR